MSAWFSLLGAPLAANERQLVELYLSGLGISAVLPVAGFLDWNEARSFVTAPEWDRRWWDAEQLEKQRLHARARAVHGEAALLEALSRTLASSETVRSAARAAAERFSCFDDGLVGSAAGAASEACHLAELALLADATEAHPFLRKRALFDGGRWPLGILSGRYLIF